MSPASSADWIDSSTPADACRKLVCTQSFQQCWPKSKADNELVGAKSRDYGVHNVSLVCCHWPVVCAAVNSTTRHAIMHQHLNLTDTCIEVKDTQARVLV